MPSFGGYSPYPRRFGGAQGKPQLQVIHEGLNAQRGSAYSKDSNSVVWVENMAIARALWAAWGTNQRLANQTNPARMTDMLPRWERILAIPVAADATDAERREAVGDRFESLGTAGNHSRLTSVLAEELGSYFVAVEYISAANAVIHVPDGTYPWGTVVPGYPWYSTTAHTLVLVQKPSNATEDDFYAAAHKVYGILDPLVGSWRTYDWYRRPTSTPISVLGGPSQAGFYLDDEHNLDNNVFDV